MPCGHQFCLGCIMHWTDRKPVCPVCSRTILIVRFSVREEDDYLQCLVTPSKELPEVCSQAGTAPSHRAENSPHGPAPFPPSFPHGTLSPAQQRAGWPEAVGGLLPEVWAELFQGQKHLLDPVLPWLCQRLEAIYGSQWWLAKNAEGCILQVLCLCGLDGKVLFQMLQPVLEGYTAPLVYGLINVIMYRCSTEAQRLLRFHAGRETNSSAASSSSFWGESPASSMAPVSSLAGSDTENQPSTSQATFCRDTGCPLSVSLSAEQVQLQEELGEVEAAGSSAQGSNCRASTSSQGRVCSHGGSQHPRKRRAPAHQDSHSCARSRSGSSTSRAPASIYSRERK
ncbi:uncharacterized protein LOC135406791 [Pseudopipra pipra]|uniref:uncharacterized protein LOC135406791 n=1 Tax=Pseudopipra pipra TaxID=415032 RepID=UPI003139E582